MVPYVSGTKPSNNANKNRPLWHLGGSAADVIVFTLICCPLAVDNRTRFLDLNIDLLR